MRIMVTPRDGIGPEIAAATMDVVEAANRTFDPGLRFDYEDTGFISLGKYGTTLRDETIERARTYDGIILGPQSLMDYPPHDKGGVNVSAGFRVKLDLHANVRPARSPVPEQRLQADGPRHHARGDGRLLSRPQHAYRQRRTHADPGCGTVRAQDHGPCLRTDRARPSSWRCVAASA